MTEPPLIYIAGPFSAPDRAGVEANIARAVAVGLEVARLGGMPVIPHANTAHPEFELVQPYPFWIAGTMALLRVCAACVMVEGWEKSSGATGEREEMLRLGRPVFASVTELAQWLRVYALLSGCTRDELRDHAFGDAEIYWTDADGNEVAEGYTCASGDSIVLREVGDHHFDGPLATPLLRLGKLGSVERNDAGGDWEDES